MPWLRVPDSLRFDVIRFDIGTRRQTGKVANPCYESGEERWGAGWRGGWKRSGGGGRGGGGGGRGGGGGWTEERERERARERESEREGRRLNTSRATPAGRVQSTRAFQSVQICSSQSSTVSAGSISRDLWRLLLLLLQLLLLLLLLLLETARFWLRLPGDVSWENAAVVVTLNRKEIATRARPRKNYNNNRNNHKQQYTISSSERRRLQRNWEEEIANSVSSARAEGNRNECRRVGSSLLSPAPLGQRNQ